jgi:hypothetical protein
MLHSGLEYHFNNFSLKMLLLVDASVVGNRDNIIQKDMHAFEK